MSVLLSTYDSRGSVESLAGLAVRWRALGAEVRVFAPEVTDNRANRRVDRAGRTTTPGRAGGVPGRRHTTGSDRS